MKILFVPGRCGVDYQSGCLFHGLVSSGHDVTDSTYLFWHSNTIDAKTKGSLYGNGISIAGNLPDRSGIRRDHTEIRDKIASKYYDAVIYGGIIHGSDFLEQVTATYPRNLIALVDGEDGTDVDLRYADVGIYFKRELLPRYSDVVFPISFAVPAVKYTYPDVDKVIDLSWCIPGIMSTYHTMREETYYSDYAQARFALTTKKGGWDCLRHYEILAAGAVPFFPDIHLCPSTTMVTWPRRLQRDANNMAYTWFSGALRNDSDYFSLRNEFRNYAREHLTTESLASRVLSKLG